MFQPRAPGRPAPDPHGRHDGPPGREQHDRVGQPRVHREAEDPHRLPQQQPDTGGDKLLLGGIDRGEWF